MTADPPTPPRSDAAEAEAVERRLVYSQAAAEQARRFRIKVAIVWVAIFIILALLLAAAQFDWQFMRDNAFTILKGVWVTLFIALCSIVVAITLAILGSLGRLSKNPIAYGVSGFYTSFFRGTPLIVQLFLWYFALPEIVINLVTRFHLPASIYHISVLSAVLAGILGLGFNYGAYMTEIFRSGILAVGPGQTEAAEALGMSYAQRMRRVVLPQAFKIIIPPTGNEFIAMTKDTALIGFLGTTLFWYDPFTMGNTLGTLGSRFVEGLLVAASAYWALTMVLTFFQTKLERRIEKAYVRLGVDKPAARSKILPPGQPHIAETPPIADPPRGI